MHHGPKHTGLKVLPESLSSPDLNNIGNLTSKEQCVRRSPGIPLNGKTFVRRNQGGSPQRRSARLLADYKKHLQAVTLARGGVLPCATNYAEGPKFRFLFVL